MPELWMRGRIKILWHNSEFHLTSIIWWQFSIMCGTYSVHPHVLSYELIIACQIPYIVLEAPSNLLLKRFSPSKWQSRIMVSWGVVLMCNAAVKNKGGLFTTRFLLGLVSLNPNPLCIRDRLNLTTGWGRTIPWCDSSDDLLVSPRRDVFTITLLL